jgi:hypothetical protein
MERWANRTKLLSGWKKPIRREILNSHISRRDEDSSHCIKTRDSDNYRAALGYPIKAPTKNVALQRDSLMIPRSLSANRGTFAFVDTSPFVITDLGKNYRLLLWLDETGAQFQGIS